MSTFKAFWVEKKDDGFAYSIIGRSVDDLPEGEVLVRVAYSSVNYKDALSATGNPGVTRNYPHTPGIDAAGTVEASSHDRFSPGDQVVVIGFDLGMNTPGGFGQYVRVPADWVVSLPKGLSVREAMVLGTAGFTAALCLDKIQRMGASPEDGPVIVTGATGGVGSVAVSLLAKLGYEVVAVSGKADKADYLKSLGATSVIGRDELSEANSRPLGKPQWAHGIDTVGGEILSNIIKGLDYNGSVAICGLVASPIFNTTVLPFILRNVNVLGIDSVELPLKDKVPVWEKLAGNWKLDNLDDMTVEIGLDGLRPVINAL
ncbi:MAG: YhdH/YhfP family quinone oxidoreductase, partial [Gammaproteobacteria bacterium]|nr:YhdH/YhfP family quinone oxidoreductase [Gammaproteobacteria bacterium]